MLEGLLRKQRMNNIPEVFIGKSFCGIDRRPMGNLNGTAISEISARPSTDFQFDDPRVIMDQGVPDL
jgi:hypothetical protein